MHIGLVTTAYPPQIDGFATYVRDLAEALSELGHSVTVLVARDAQAVGEGRPDGNGVTVVSLRPPPRTLAFAAGLPQLAWSLRVRQALRTIHRRRPFDVIEFMNWGGLAAAHSLRKVAPQALRVTTSIGQVEAAGGWLERLRIRALERVEAATVRRSDLVIVPARGHWHALLPSYGPRAAEPAVVPFGIDVGRVAPSASAAESGPCRLLYVGRLSRRKGFDVLMAALPAVVRGSSGEVHLTVVGRDPAPHGVPAWGAATAGLDDDVLRCVTYLGEAPDHERDAAYSSCDVFVAPSRYESFGLMYIEAMAHGVPVVGCRAGGTPEVVADGVTGFLVPPGEAGALAEALLRLVDDPQMRARMAAAARRAAVAEFDRRLMAQRTLEEYRLITVT